MFLTNSSMKQADTLLHTFLICPPLFCSFYDIHSCDLFNRTEQVNESDGLRLFISKSNRAIKPDRRGNCLFCNSAKPITGVELCSSVISREGFDGWSVRGYGRHNKNTNENMFLTCCDSKWQEKQLYKYDDNSIKDVYPVWEKWLFIHRKVCATLMMDTLTMNIYRKWNIKNL